MIRSSVLAAGASLALVACAHHVLSVEQPHEASEWKGADSVALGFGAAERVTVTAECPTGLIDAMRVRQSFFDSLVTVFTLGLVAPARVSYVCHKLDTEEGNTNEPETNATSGD